MNVCLITTSQPSANPRLVKEADALTEMGAAVHVIGAQRADWAVDADRALLASRSWTCEILDWRRAANPALFWRSRVRHLSARRLLGVPPLVLRVLEAAMSRVGPDLRAAASRTHADLYIAHNIGALPVAIAAAARTNARLGFDAEDFHSGQLSASGDPTMLAATEVAERSWVPRCDYVTAASPGIADAYRRGCGIDQPTVVLNVFPRQMRPPARRVIDSGAPVSLYWFSQTIGPDRGLDDAVLAMGQLHPHHVTLHLRGAWQAGYEEALRTTAGEAGVRQERIVVHRPAPADEMVSLAAGYDIGLALEPAVNVNNDLAISNKLFTYVLAGTATIATSTAGHLSVAPQLGSAVRLYRPGDVDALARHLRAWIEHRDALDEARHTAWRAGDTRFNWDVEKAAFLSAVRPLLVAA